MSMQQQPTQISRQEQPAYTAKLVHATNPKQAEVPIEFVFSVLDETGTEHIVNAEVPNGNYLYELCEQQGWLSQAKQPIRRRVG